MARKSLIVHVGGNKTGSSAIQGFLSLNADAFRKHGIVIPDQNLEGVGPPSGFHVFAFEKLFRDSQGSARLSAALGQIFESAGDARTVLLSAENLAANPAAPALFSGLRDKYDVRIILYVRRQDDYLLSSWQQWYAKVSNDFWAWMTSVVGLMGNWRTYLEQWETTIARELITVRVYERNRLDGGDAIRDFHNCLGTDAPFQSMRYPAQRINPSYSDAIADLVKGNEAIFENAHDNRFYAFVKQVSGDRYTRNSRHSIITYQQRMAILQRYADANAWVLDNYFPGSSGSLFSMPKPENYEYLTPDAMHAEQLEFLVTALYSTYKERTG